MYDLHYAKKCLRMCLESKFNKENKSCTKFINSTVLNYSYCPHWHCYSPTISGLPFSAISYWKFLMTKAKTIIETTFVNVA